MPQQIRIGWRSGSSSQTAVSIVTSGLIMNLDANNVSSYSGTGTTWTDLSGSNNVTLVNGVGYSSADGGSLVFDGVNDWVENLSSTLLNNLSKFTLNTWFKVNNTSLNNSIFSFNWNSAGLVDILLGVYGNYLFCQVDNGQDGGGYIQNFTSTSWNNVQVVFDGTLSGNSNRLKIYLNGVLLTLQYDSYTVPATTANNASRFALGAYINGNFNNRLFGNIANCLIYNTALSASEVTQNFNATKARFGFPTLDTDAQAFITAATITELNQQSAVNTLVTQLKTYGIWTKLKAVYPFVGGTANSHKFNLKDPRDLDAAYRLVFSGGWTHTSTGAQPNGTNAFADTKLTPSSTFNTTTFNHLSYYSRTSAGSQGYSYDMGSYDFNVGGSNAMIIRRLDNSSNFAASYPANTSYYVASTTVTDGSGLFLGTQNGTSIKYFRNSSLIATNTGVSTNAPQAVYSPIFIGTLGEYGYATTNRWSNKEAALVSIGDGLTDTEAANFYTAVQTFQTTLGRQIGVPIVADTDAQAFLNAAVITDSTQASAVNTLVTSLKTAGVWTKMKALYPFVGGSAASHKFNLKDPRDLDAAFRLQFNGGWTHTSTGATPNGTTGYANTYLNPYVVFGNNQGHHPAGSTHSLVHVSKYSRTNSIPSNGYDGVYSHSGSQARYMFSGWSSTYGSPNGYAALNGWGWGQSYSSVTLGNRTDGFFVVNRDGFTSLKSFRNNTLISTNTTDIRSYNETGLQLNLNPDQVFFIGARNDAYDLSLRAFAYNSFETSFQSIGWSLTDAETTALNTAVQAFQTTLGRAV